MADSDISAPQSSIKSPDAEHEALKPCPFCGGDALTERETLKHQRIGPRFHSHCIRCGASGSPHEKRDEAIKRWNTRPREEALTASIGGAVAIITKEDEAREGLRWLILKDIRQMIQDLGYLALCQRERRNVDWEQESMEVKRFIWECFTDPAEERLKEMIPAHDLRVQWNAESHTKLGRLATIVKLTAALKE